MISTPGPGAESALPLFLERASGRWEGRTPAKLGDGNKGDRGALVLVCRLVGAAPGSKAALSGPEPTSEGPWGGSWAMEGPGGTLLHPVLTPDFPRASPPSRCTRGSGTRQPLTLQASAASTSLPLAVTKDRGRFLFTGGETEAGGHVMPGVTH